MPTSSRHTRIVIPLRSFRSAKRRLSGVLDPAQRDTLARAMAAQVIGAARGWPVAVACDDDEVALWARSHGAEVVRTDGHDLNGSVSMARSDSRAAGWPRIAIVHADLPLVTSFGDVLRIDTSDDQVVIVPDRRGTGTNLLVVPCGPDLTFAYGPGSFTAHLAAARDVGLDVEVVEDPAFGWDVDEPDDLAVPPGAHTSSPPVRGLIDAGILTIRSSLPVDHAGPGSTHPKIHTTGGMP